MQNSGQVICIYFLQAFELEDLLKLYIFYELYCGELSSLIMQVEIHRKCSFSIIKGS